MTSQQHYPDPPGRRIPYHENGAEVLHGSYDGTTEDFYGTMPPLGGNPSTLWEEATQADKEKLNSETPIGGLFVGPTRHAPMMGVLLPALYDLSGFWMNKYDGGGAPDYYWLAVSPDTTNLTDGTWTQWSVVGDINRVEIDRYRTHIVTAPVAGIRGIKTASLHRNKTAGFRNLHLYGTVSAGQTLNRLTIIDTTTDSPFVTLNNNGFTPRGSAKDFTVNIRNESPTLTATGVALSGNALTGPAGTWLSFADATEVFLPVLSIPDIPPGAEVGPFTVRQVTPDDALLHVASAYITPTVTFV